MGELSRLEKNLRLAALLHRRKSADGDAQLRQGFELRFTLARLGLNAADLDRIASVSAPEEIPQTLREDLRSRLSRESLRLRRLAKAGRATYDLDRHVAVVSALCWLDETSNRHTVPTPDLHTSHPVSAGWRDPGEPRGCRFGPKPSRAISRRDGARVIRRFAQPRSSARNDPPRTA